MKFLDKARKVLEMVREFWTIVSRDPELEYDAHLAYHDLKRIVERLEEKEKKNAGR